MKKVSDKARYIMGSLFAGREPLRFDRRFIVEHPDIAKELRELADTGYLLFEDDLPFRETTIVRYSVPADVDIKDMCREANALNQSGMAPKVRVYKHLKREDA